MGSFLVLIIETQHELAIANCSSCSSRSVVQMKWPSWWECFDGPCPSRILHYIHQSCHVVDGGCVWLWSRHSSCIINDGQTGTTRNSWWSVSQAWYMVTVSLCIHENVAHEGIQSTVIKFGWLLWCWYALPFSLGAGPVPGILLPENFASRICAKAVVLSLGVHWVRETDASRVNLQPRLPVLPTQFELDLLVDSWSHSTSLVQGLSCEVVSKFLVQGSATPVLRRWVVWVQISNFMIGLMFLNVVKRFRVSSVYLGFPTVHVAAVFYVAKNARWKQRVLHWKKLSTSWAPLY
jgi:hypothetical protein